MSWNQQAIRNFLDTGLLGAGLGSVRASNWFIATLGSLGLPGAVLSGAVLVSLARAGRGVRDPGMRSTIMALKAACLGLFINDLLTAASPVPSVFLAAMAGTLTGLARGSEIAETAPVQRQAHRPVRPATQS